MKKTVFVIGGDLRQKTVAEELLKEGFCIEAMSLYEGGGFDASRLSEADVVVLPIPVSYDNVYINAPILKENIKIDDLLENLRPDCLVLGACISEAVKNKLDARSLKYADYYEREELIIKNAIPTAEGTIEIALSEMPITLFESRVLVTGYGRVGKVLAERLLALGADVTVSARKCADFAWIEERGMKSIHTEMLSSAVGDFDLIVNTIPTVVLPGEVLLKVRDDCLIIDLASKPGGVDFAEAKQLGKNVIWALSLPGKSAPITSGKIIKETIMNIFAETGV